MGSAPARPVLAVGVSSAAQDGHVTVIGGEESGQAFKLDLHWTAALQFAASLMRAAALSSEIAGVREPEDLTALDAALAKAARDA